MDIYSFLLGVFGIVAVMVICFFGMVYAIESKMLENDNKTK